VQLVRLASSVGSFDITDTGTSLNFSSTMALVNQSLLAHLNPVKTLLNVSACMAGKHAPAQPAKNGHNQRPVEATLILSSTSELVKTNSPSGAGNGFAILSILFMVLLLIVSRSYGIVLCRIRHLFARAREGICAVVATQSFLQRKSPLIRLRVNGDFLF
jgi:hypothetical protein